MTFWAGGFQVAKGNRAQLGDFVDLALLYLAKLQRRQLSRAEESSDFYEDFFTENDIAVLGSGGDPRRQQRGTVLREAAWTNMPTGARVLDVGCGLGDNLRYVMREDAEFYGLEYSERTAREANRQLSGRATVSVGSATHMPYPSEFFDVALCIEVLEHIERDDLAIAEIARVLKPGGALIISLPYRHWFRYYFTAMGHFRHYTRTEMARLLDGAGFEVERFLPNLPRWSRLINYAYVLCRVYALIARLVGVRASPVEIRLPFAKRPLIAVLASALEPLRKKDCELDYPALETSTFVLARKRSATLG